MGLRLEHCSWVICFVKLFTKAHHWTTSWDTGRNHMFMCSYFGSFLSHLPIKVRFPLNFLRSVIVWIVHSFCYMLHVASSDFFKMTLTVLCEEYIWSASVYIFSSTVLHFFHFEQSTFFVTLFPYISLLHSGKQNFTPI